MSYKYYQNELNYLRALGAEFAQRYPESASLLGAGARDPDVERLLQGFAFLTARIHERLDDQFSQVAEGFLSVLWPQVLKPIPSITMVQFYPDRQLLKKDITLPRQIELKSKRYSWGQYRFQTCRPVTMYPFSLSNASLEERDDSSFLRLTFEVFPGATLSDSDLGSLLIHISGDDPRFTYGWLQWLTQHARSAVLISDSGDRSVEVKLHPVGFSDDIENEVLFPDAYDEVPGHRTLSEFFSFPEHFHFIRVDSLEPLRLMEIESRFELLIDFGHERSLSGAIRNVSRDSFKLYCTPAVNLFESFARISLDHTRSEYVARSDEIDIEHHEVYSILDVTGIEKGIEGKRVTHRPYYSQLLSGDGSAEQMRYRVRFDDIHVKRGNRSLPGRECFISFDQSEPTRDMAIQSVSIEMLCTNRGGATSMRRGDLNQPSEMVPANVTFANISEPTQLRPAPGSPANLWLLISGFAMSHRTVLPRMGAASIENLKAILQFHGRDGSGQHSAADRWLTGLEGVSIEPGITAEDGAPLRILNTCIDFHCEYDRIPEFYLFGLVLSEFMRRTATINTRMGFRYRFNGDDRQALVWPQRTGTCTIL